MVLGSQGHYIIIIVVSPFICFRHAYICHEYVSTHKRGHNIHIVHATSRSEWEMTQHHHLGQKNSFRTQGLTNEYPTLWNKWTRRVNNIHDSTKVWLVEVTLISTTCMRVCKVQTIRWNFILHDNRTNKLVCNGIIILNWGWLYNIW